MCGDNRKKTQILVEANSPRSAKVHREIRLRSWTKVKGGSGLGGVFVPQRERGKKLIHVINMEAGG